MFLVAPLFLNDTGTEFIWLILKISPEPRKTRNKRRRKASAQGRIYAGLPLPLRGCASALILFCATSGNFSGEREPG